MRSSEGQSIFGTENRLILPVPVGVAPVMDSAFRSDAHPQDFWHSSVIVIGP